MENYKIELLAIQGTKQTDIFIKEMGEYLFFNSGIENRKLGVGFLVSKKLQSEITEFKAVTNRLCKIRIRGRYRKISIINVHCPTEEKEYEEKEKFYEEIEKVYNGIPKYDVKMIIGDFNAKIGKEEIYEYKSVIGTHSKHDRTNENGKMLIEFATEKNMRIASTYFHHKTIHQGTWISPDGKTVNQIDHLLIEQQMCNGCEELQRSRFTYRSYTSESKNKIQKTSQRSKTKEYQNTVSNGKIKRRKD
jgi:predicted Fe-S protein YdhL (DUF1289 family)